MSELKHQTEANAEQFDVILELNDGTKVAKANRQWYRISDYIDENAEYWVETTPTATACEAALLDIGDNMANKDGAVPSQGGLDCDHHGLIKIRRVIKPHSINSDKPYTRILKLGANYYKNDTDGEGQRTVIDAIRYGVVVKD